LASAPALILSPEYPHHLPTTPPPALQRIRDIFRPIHFRPARAQTNSRFYLSGILTHTRDFRIAPPDHPTRAWASSRLLQRALPPPPSRAPALAQSTLKLILLPSKRRPCADHASFEFPVSSCESPILETRNLKLHHFRFAGAVAGRADRRALACTSAAFHDGHGGGAAHGGPVVCPCNSAYGV